MFKIIKIRHCITMLLLLCVNVLFAQDVRFTASVSKTQVGTGEPFEISFSINGNGDRFSPPSFAGFQVVSGPNVSSSMTSINGNTTVSNAYSYDLVATKEGVFTIGSATIVANGRKMGTNAIKIKVVKGQPVQQGQTQNAPDNRVVQKSSADLSKSLFIRTIPNKITVYQGEQLTLSYRLYTRVGIVDSRIDKFPDLNGFWSEDIKNEQQQAQWRTGVYQGAKYNIADVKQTILFPEHSGNIRIEPFEMTFIVRVPVASNDIMDQFFGSSYEDVQYKVKSTAVMIHVKPLPETGKPAGFTGAVGNFSIKAALDKNELKANEALNYSVKVSGSGNLNLLRVLNVNFPPDFEKYDPKITDSLTHSERGITGSRTYNYLIIPRHHGDFTLDPLQFSYFNPATNKYVVLSTKSFKVKVNKGLAENNVTAFSSANKQDVQLLNKDIRYIKTDHPNLSAKGDRFYGSIWYCLLLGIGPVLCIAGFIYRNRHREINSDPVMVKNRRAGKEAAKHLANAQKQLTAGNTKAFYDAVFKGLYGYLSDKLNISAADLNKDEIASGLKSRSVDEQLISKLLDTLDLCEMGRYAPVTLSEQEVFDKAKGIINDIENEIK